MILNQAEPFFNQKLKLLQLEGKSVPVYHRYGKQGFSRPPKFRQLLLKANDKIAELITGEKVHHQTIWPVTETIAIQKWQETHVPGYGNNPVAKLQQLGYQLEDITRKLSLVPLEICVAHSLTYFLLNSMLNEGIDEIWDLADATGGTTPYNNANARVGVGNSSAAVSPTQTGLQGASTAFAAMDVGFPTSTTQRINCKGTFPTGQAEFAWEEYTIDNGVTRNKNLNRALQSNGTKPSGQTWTLEVQITMS